MFDLLHLLESFRNHLFGIKNIFLILRIRHLLKKKKLSFMSIDISKKQIRAEEVAYRDNL